VLNSCRAARRVRFRRNGSLVAPEIFGELRRAICLGVLFRARDKRRLGGVLVPIKGELQRRGALWTRMAFEVSTR
jgi:hypothetical protein